MSLPRSSGDLHAQAELPAVEPQRSHLPRYGLARLGTTRWRIGGQPRRIHFDPTGHELLVALGNGTHDKEVQFWNIAEERLVRSGIGHERPVWRATYSADGRYAYSCSYDETIRIWDAAAAQELHRIKTFATPRSLDVSPDGRTLAAAISYRVVVWDLETRRERFRTQFAEWDVEDVSISPDGAFVAGARLESVTIWDASTGEERLKFVVPRTGFKTLAFSPDGAKLAAARSWDGEVSLWNVSVEENLEPAERLLFRTSGHDAVAFSPDGSELAVSADWDQIRILEAATGEELRRFTGHTDRVVTLTFSPDGRTLASGSHDYTIRFWDVESGRPLVEPLGHGHVVIELRFADENTLISASEDETAIVWDIPTARETGRFAEHSHTLMALAVSPDGSRAATADDFENAIRVWDVRTARTVSLLAYPESRAQAFVFTPDGSRLISTGFDESVVVWDLSGGRELRRRKYDLIDDFSHCIALSHDGQRVAIASQAGGIRILDADSLEDVRELGSQRLPTVSSMSLAFSMDDQRLVSANFDGTLTIWDLATGAALHELPGHQRWAHCVAVSPDGNLIASCGYDETVRLWSMHNGALLSELPGHRGGVRAVAFSPSGKRLASAGDDTSILVWDVEAALRGSPASAP